MTRFWITLEEGVEFVIRALNEMKGGEIFIPKLPSFRIVDLAEAVSPGCRREIVGIRPGEKIHETLVPTDDKPYTLEFSDKYLTLPQIVIGNGKRCNGGTPLGPEFQGYRSDKNNQWLSVNQLRKFIEEGGRKQVS